MMADERKVCYCYGVSLGKLKRFARRENPKKPSQLSECLGAGTGCGWCIPVLKKIHEINSVPDEPTESWADLSEQLDPEKYAESRKKYLQEEKNRNRF